MADDSDGFDGVDIDSGLLEPDESLDDLGIDDVLDEGYSPPDRSWTLGQWGFTAREAAGHEQLSARLAREDTLCRESMPAVQRRWLASNRAMRAEISATTPTLY